jgi:hypothetical protein
LEYRKYFYVHIEALWKERSDVVETDGFRVPPRGWFVGDVSGTSSAAQPPMWWRAFAKA